MNINKLASYVIDLVLGGLSGIEATFNMSIEEVEDAIVDTRLEIIKKYSLQNAIPRKDLFYAITCIEVDCKTLDKCCISSDYDLPQAHFEIPQIVNDFGELAIEYIGSTNKQLKFKVYTGLNFKFHKYKTRGKDKPFVYIDTTPNENNMYDCYLFNAPMLERVTVIGIFKDPRLLEQYTCCGFTEADNMTWLASEIKQTVIQRFMAPYRQYIQPPIQNDQNPH